MINERQFLRLTALLFAVALAIVMYHVYGVVQHFIAILEQRGL